MPSMTAAVGGLTLPIAAGAANSALLDPTVVGLADYLRFCLRNDLNAKLAVLAGMAADAVPAANVFHQDPGTSFVRNGFPALYVWWPGQSKVVQDTLVYSRRERTIHAMYVFDEHVDPVGIRSRGGLLGAVDASFAKASDRGRHTSYTPSGYTAGTDVRTALGLLMWRYEGAQKGEMAAAIPATSSSPGGAPEGVVKRGYPALMAQFTVWERIQPDTLEDPADVQGDVLVDLETSELGGDTVDILSGYLLAPDGSEVDSGEEDTGTIPNTIDTTDPVVTAWTPVDQTLTSYEAFGVDVTDNVGISSLSIEVYQYTGADIEPAYANGAFIAPYDTLSTVTEIDGGYRFSIVRTGGWLGYWIYPTVDVADAAGNVPAISGDWYQPGVQHGVTFEFATVPVPDVLPPVFSAFTPATQIVPSATAITFDISDVQSFIYNTATVITANYGNAPSETVLDGPVDNNFVAPFFTSSTWTPISGASHVRVSLTRDGGWPVGLVSIDVTATDSAGNVGTETFYFTAT